MSTKANKSLSGRSNRKIVFFAFLTLLVVVFIFGNSLLSQAASDEHSKTVAAMMDPTIDPQGGVDDYEWLNVIVRKAAHMAEFALLGAVLYGLIWSVHEKHDKWFVGAMLFAGLMVAVIDESIQYLVPGRSPLVTDVLFDFGGTVLGVLFGWLLSVLYVKRKNKEKRSKSDC